MLDLKFVFSPMTTNFPNFKVVDGVNMKLDHYDVTVDGIIPVYVETDEVSEEQALAILLGGDAE